MQTLDQPITRTRVLIGENDDPTRRAGKQVIAQSYCEFPVPNKQAMDRCVDALRASDEVLRKQGNNPLYNWVSTWTEESEDGSGKVIFGVAWYDEQFFAEKKETYFRGDHLAMYLHMGVAADDIVVEHWKSA